MSPEAGAPRARYVYGVVRSAGDETMSVSEPGLEGAPVTTVIAGGLGVLVSPFSGERARSSRANLMAHERVVEEVGRQGTVLPVRFGTIMPDPDSVVTDFINPNAQTLALLLEEMAGKIEFRVKVSYLPDVALRDAVSGSASLRRLQQRVRAKPSATTYGDQIELGELAVARLEEVKAQDSANVLDRLNHHAMFTQVLNATNDNVALYVAILLDVARTEQFEAALERLASEQNQRLRFELVGPLAPWDFVDLGASDLAAAGGASPWRS